MDGKILEHSNTKLSAINRPVFNKILKNLLRVVFQ